MKKGLGPLVPALRKAAGPRQSRGVDKQRTMNMLTLRAQYVDFLPEREAISGRRHSPLATVLVVVVSAFFFLFLAWSALSRVEQAASAPGQVRPDGRVKVVNHPEGGRIAEILVREGDMVKAGQVLFRLDPELFATEAQKQTQLWQQLAAESARLDAESQNARQIRFPDELMSERPDLVLTHTRLFEARRDALSARREAADRQIEQRTADINGLGATIAAKTAGTEILRQQANSLYELAGKGYFPWLRYQSVAKDLSDADGEVARLQTQLSSARSALNEARVRRRAVDEDWYSSVLTDLNKSRTDRDNALGISQQAAARLRNLVITASDDGIAQGLTVNNIGQAIKPLEPLLNIVPVSDNLVIEARVENKDIGYIRVGQVARVKVRTYEFNRFGELNGVVEQVSADGTVDPQNNQIFYKVMIRTDRNYMGPGVGQNPVTPGMQVDIDMITGERSVLSYLTDRISGTFRNSLKEH